MNIIFDKNRKKIIKFSLVFLIIFSLVFFYLYKAEEKTLIVNANSLSNEKIGWGIKRNDNHKQPDLGAKNRQLLEENQGIAIGNETDKYIYLTFDEGYEAGYTEKILEVLKQNEVKACFFITAHYVNREPELVRKMIEEGHIVGNHTVNHKSMPTLSDEKIKEEVMDLHKTIYEKFNYEMKYIRPPMGEYSQRTLSITNSLGYKTVMWSFAYEDWNEDKQPDNQKAKEKILDNLHNGEIILLHGNSKTNTDILDEIIKEIKNIGYEFKSLDEFIK